MGGKRVMVSSNGERVGGLVDRGYKYIMDAWVLRELRLGVCVFIEIGYMCG